MKKAVQVFNLVFALLFLVSAILQYNDIDPYIWIPIYLYGTWVCFQASRNKFSPSACIAGVFVFAIYAIYKFFEKDGVLDWIQVYNTESITGAMDPGKKWIEETREFFGLLILIIVFLINYFYYRRRIV